MKASRRQTISWYLGFVGSLISNRFSMRSSILFCLKPMRNSRKWLEGTRAVRSQPWGTSGQACFKARLSQLERFGRVLDVPSCTSTRTRREDQPESILGKTRESRFEFEKVLNSYSYDNRTGTAQHVFEARHSFFFCQLPLPWVTTVTQLTLIAVRTPIVRTFLLSLPPYNWHFDAIEINCF